MAKMVMKKSSSRRISMKGGRDWKICRRFLGGKMGRGVRRAGQPGGLRGAHACPDGGLVLLAHRTLHPTAPWLVTSDAVLS